MVWQRRVESSDGPTFQHLLAIVKANGISRNVIPFSKELARHELVATSNVVCHPKFLDH